jgi:hypothetical protein
MEAMIDLAMLDQNIGRANNDWRWRVCFGIAAVSLILIQTGFLHGAYYIEYQYDNAGNLSGP